MDRNIVLPLNWHGVGRLRPAGADVAGKVDRCGGNERQAERRNDRHFYDARTVLINMSGRA